MEVITHYNEFSIPSPLQMRCSPSTVEQERNSRFSVCCCLKEPHKNCWSCTHRKCLSDQKPWIGSCLAGWQTGWPKVACGELLQNEHEMLVALYGSSVFPPVHPCYFSGAQKYNLLAGTLVLSQKIFILRIHVYRGLLILYCNIRWAAETSKGWAIYF